jgi:8-oxo-dGDP phosphatase
VTLVRGGGRHGLSFDWGTLKVMKTLATKEVYANPWMTVREDVVLRHDGSTGRHAVVDGPDLALVVPADADRLHLVEQYRHALTGLRWEFPAGNAEPSIDADETAAAARELREETGFSAETLTRLGTFDVAPGLSSQRCAVFLATDLTPGAPDRDPAEQDMRSAWFTRAEVEVMIADGTVTDAKTLAAYTLLLLRGQALHAG